MCSVAHCDKHFCRGLDAWKLYVEACDAVQRTDAKISKLRETTGGTDLNADSQQLERLQGQLREVENQASSLQGQLAGLGKVWSHLRLSRMNIMQICAVRAHNMCWGS
jgi:hypothetical protein